MDDVLRALSIPVLLLVSGLYTACDCRRRRRHPAPPSPYTHQALRIAERRLLAHAEDISDRAYATLGGLYDTPSTRNPATSAAPAAPATPVTAGDVPFVSAAP